MTETTVASFDEQAQNTHKASRQMPENLRRALYHTISDRQTNLIHDIEILVCGKINETGFPNVSGKTFYPSLCPAVLSNRNGTRPYSLARHWTWFFLYHHPSMHRIWGTPAIGRRYGRDHSTVRHGILRTEADVALRRTDAAAVQSIANDLEAMGYSAFQVKGRVS